LGLPRTRGTGHELTQQALDGSSLDWTETSFAGVVAGEGLEGPVLVHTRENWGKAVEVKGRW